MIRPLQVTCIEHQSAKLVRDGMAGIAQQDGRGVVTPVPKGEEVYWLLRKAVEEAHELHDALGVDELAAELGDLMDVCNVLYERIGPARVDRARAKKFITRGGFVALCLLTLTEPTEPADALRKTVP